MAAYTPRQLVLLLVVLAVAGLGLAVGHWRRLHPDLVDRVEQLDRDPPAPAPPHPPGRPSGRVREPPARAPSSRFAARAPGLRRGARKLSRADGDGRDALDLNRAAASELMALPGVGPVLAARIVDVRESRGRFTSVEDLRRVQGVGAARLERLRPLVTIAE